MNINNITIINNIIANRKIKLVQSSFFFHVIDFKVFEIFSKHNECGLISESFALS